ncbi:MAG TPA: hypothetical protein VJT15_22860 [Pyrinomonadaceae bacterium]|nr:hypothetical protein [Pyrinomonadaceae bacterium]
MRVELESIHLNHDPTSKTTGAFSIRRNEKCPIVRPEWRRDISLRPEDAPAAYAYELVENIAITIQAELSCDDPSVKTLFVRARDGYLNPKKRSIGNHLRKMLTPLARESLTTNVLGSAPKTEVTFVNGKGMATLLLRDVKICEVGVSVSDVIWNWQYSLDGNDWEDLVTSLHRVYTVVNIPFSPWQPASRDIDNTQLPWTEALDFACRAAASAKDVTAAATQITQWVSRLGNGFIRYDVEGNGPPAFAFERGPRFDLTQFLLLLNGGTPLLGVLVNCDDCSAIVTSFSNILGCLLGEGEMGEDSFKLKPHLRVGVPKVLTSNFSRHNVSWLGLCTADDPVFDACVRFDFDPDPKRERWAVATSISFREYRPLLTDDAKNCTPQGRRLDRKIGGLSFPFEALYPHEFGPAAQVVNALKSEAKLFRDPELSNLRLIQTTLVKYLLQSFWRSRKEIGVTYCLDTYECGSAEAVRTLVDELLSSFNLRPDKVEDPTVGNEMYASKNRSSIVFVRGQFVLLTRNTGRKTSSSEDLAKKIDELFTNQQVATEGA